MAVERLEQIHNEMRKRIRQFPSRIGYPLVRDLARKTPNRGLGYGTNKDGSRWYSGRAAANWRVHTGNPYRNWIVPHSPDPSANARETAEIAKTKLIEIGRRGITSWSVSNPVFYLDYLERGWSKKARTGFIQFIVAAHQRRADKFIEKYFDPSKY